MALTPVVFSDDDEPTRVTAPAPGGPVDAESYTVYRPDQGVPVDAPDTAVTLTWSDVSSGDARRRVPLVPAWLLSAHTRRATLRALADNVGYFAAFHALRGPKYAIKTALYAPRGAARIVGRALWWASAEEGNWSLRQHAATSNDAYTWQSLNRTRSKESKPRWMLVGAAALAACGGGSALAVSDAVPPIGWYAALTGAVLLAARVGRPADKPITDRVSTSPRFTRLTADQVRAALVSLRLPGLTEGSQVEFVHPGIHRDGPGWLARVNLPAGMEAVRVLDRRGNLSSALRLPVDQVWPGAGPDHAGQLDLWVGYQPASKMGTPRWALIASNAQTSVFKEEEFGSDERQRPVKTSLFARSFLIGGQPGSGKSYAARALALMAALDPTVEFKIAEFKGTGDFIDFEPLCSTYVVGVDEEAIRQGGAILAWALGEAERRGKRILAAKQAGHAPEGKVTPELARKRGSGLHPVVIVIDEAHELFAADKDAADAAERLIKRARALNMVVILATQIPDKTSLPPNITRCVTNRWCLSVAGQVENDMILGTGAYKRGITGTVYRPVVDAGWGVMTGGPTPTAVRSQYPTPDQAAAILARALLLRGGNRQATAAQAPARDLLADLVDVAAGNGQHWTAAAPALVERWPEAYPGLTPDALSEIARSLGVASVDVKVGGKVLKGYRRTDIGKILAARTGPDGR
ncbi:AAA family ATPase [Catellatospora chokoriensis]|uniref:AAA family ATPase n=3 Tax=Catellatospora chokoriensis TaxID=310353 RepID=UPI001782545D|nr:AAA family ATPase [Catellatospora chokoriensis]